MGLLDKGNMLKLYIHRHSLNTHEINKIVKATKIASSNHIMKVSNLTFKSLKHENEEKKRNILSKCLRASDPACVHQHSTGQGCVGGEGVKKMLINTPWFKKIWPEELPIGNYRTAFNLGYLPENSFC